MIKEKFEENIKRIQNQIVSAFQLVDPGVKIIEDNWDRPGGGGGCSKILTKGKYIEKGGVNISIVNGVLPIEMQERLNAISASFYASGISLVIHPLNPFAPTVHFNIRYFELYKDSKLVDSWFGGGMDLTPFYPFVEDVIHFHTVLKNDCDRFDKTYYSDFKNQCDSYFYNAHRNEHRGIGGVFFDYLKPSKEKSIEHLFDFTISIGDSFIQAYLPIIEKRKDIIFNDSQREWQEIRRGRYVEFNLIHDRGTLFGLKTSGRTESILMSLPPRVRWEYNHHPEFGSEEEKLFEILKPKQWV